MLVNTGYDDSWSFRMKPQIPGQDFCKSDLQLPVLHCLPCTHFLGSQDAVVFVPPHPCIEETTKAILWLPDVTQPSGPGSSTPTASKYLTHVLTEGLNTTFILSLRFPLVYSAGT